jgi:hypothetical protein
MEISGIWLTCFRIIAFPFKMTWRLVFDVLKFIYRKIVAIIGIGILSWVISCLLK